MILISDNDYRNIARSLLASIGAGDFFNGTVAYDTEKFTSSLRMTLIIYREPALDPADVSRSATRITDIVPVWWEYNMHGLTGECLTDFNWKTLKEHLI